MRRWWTRGLTLLLVGCHSGEPFDLGGDVADPASLPSDPPTDAPAPDAGVLVQDVGLPEAREAGQNRTLELSRSALGATCGSDGDCESTHCSAGRCCNRVCGDCEECSSEGRCAPLAECRFAACDAGVCRAARGPLGATCQDKGECESGFCADGVCCESPCDGVCQQCSADGFCNLFPAVDSDCADVVCPEDTICRTYVPLVPRACAAAGRCAVPEDCLFRNAALGQTCDKSGSRCDGYGACQSNPTVPASEPTQVCPQPGGGPQEVRALLDGADVDCWVGDTFAAGVTCSRGSIATGIAGPGSVRLGAYLFGIGASAKTQAFDAAGVLLPGCVVVDPSADRTWTYATFIGETCRNAAFARVTSHANNNGDL